MHMWNNMMAAAIVAWPALAMAAARRRRDDVDEIQQQSTYARATYALHKAHRCRHSGTSTAWTTLCRSRGVLMAR